MTGRQPGGTRPSVDWAAIRGRIDTLATIDAAASRLSEDEARAVLEERARRLAAPLQDDRVEGTLDLIRLGVAGETYGIESRFVLEVLSSAELALFPGATPPVIALMAWRGELLTLLDLRVALELEAMPEARTGPILVLGESGPAFGILVDEVLDIREIPVSSLRGRANAAGGRDDFLRGTTAEALLVIDAAALIRTFS